MDALQTDLLPAARKTALPHETLLLPGAVGDPPADLPEYDWEEIKRHNTPRDLWLVVGGHVYNVGEFLFHHPGGAEILLAQHGHDATAAFLKIGHPDYALALTRSFLIGKLRPGSQPPVYVAPRLSGGCPFAHAFAAPPPDQAQPAAPSAEHTQAVPPSAGMQPTARPADTRPAPSSARPSNRAPSPAPGLREIPIAIKKLKLNGERFVNFDILNDVRSQVEYCRQFGHIYQVPLPGKNGRRLVVVSDAALLDEVAGNAEQFGKQVDGINFFKQLAISRGNGISVVSDSPFYQRVRRIMIPWYSPHHQRTQFDQMKEVAKRTVASWQQIPDDEPIDMRDWMIRYSMEISGRGACAYAFNLTTPDPKPGVLAAAVPASLRTAVARVAEPAPDKGGLFASRERKRQSRAFHAQAEAMFQEADRLIETRRHQRLNGTQTDLVTRLLTEPDPETGERLDNGVIRDQVLMHLSNGFNGPSVTLAWIPLLLTQHPEVESRVIAEIDSIAGGDPDYEMQYADLLQMTYTTQVIKETLRVLPPMPVTIRNSLQDGRLGPWRMRKGDIILIASLAAHRDSRYWGGNPEAFDPDHFAVEKVAARPRHAFVPFSVGERQCMAQEVTFMMLRVAIFHFYNSFRLRVPAEAKVATRAVVTMSPVAVPVLRQRREGKDERQAALAARAAMAPRHAPREETAGDRPWDVPSAIPAVSSFGHTTIAFGSNFGVSRDLAEQLGERSRRYGFTSEVLPLNALAERDRPAKPWLLMVCTATYTGNPPSNANKFKAWLEKELPGADCWRNCHFVVFGLGNSQWVAFQRFPRFVYERLKELGATPVAELGSADVGMATWADSFTSWGDVMWPQVIALAGAKPSEAAERALVAEQSEPATLAALSTGDALAASLDGHLLVPARPNNALDLRPIPARVIAARELQASNALGSTRHIEIQLPHGFDYRVGDHIGVCPRNDTAMVERLARCLGAPLDALFRVPDTMRRVRCVPRGMVLQVEHALTRLVDFMGPVTPRLLTALHDSAEATGDRALLDEMQKAAGGAQISPDSPAAKLLASRFNLVELLELFSSVQLGFFRFLEAVPSLRPRYYSASSSPGFHGKRVVHITVGRLDAPLPGLGDRRFRGLCSHYLHSVPDSGTIDIFLDKAEGFHMQEDMTAPMVMVSAGTGFAPMRAFLFERLRLKRRGVALGPALVFNGIRSLAVDLLYRDELAMFQDEGVLDGVHVAASRDPAAPRQYVQHKLLEHAASVWELMNRGAYVFICGSGAMRDEVRAAFVRIAATEGGMTEPAADAYLTALEQEAYRYRPDVWG